MEVISIFITENSMKIQKKNMDFLGVKLTIKFHIFIMDFGRQYKNVLSLVCINILGRNP
jgi:hypothetical protein